MITLSGFPLLKSILLLAIPLAFIGGRWSGYQASDAHHESLTEARGEAFDVKLINARLTCANEALGVEISHMNDVQAQLETVRKDAEAKQQAANDRAWRYYQDKQERDRDYALLEGQLQHAQNARDDESRECARAQLDIGVMRELGAAIRAVNDPNTDAQSYRGETDSGNADQPGSIDPQADTVNASRDRRGPGDTTFAVRDLAGRP